MADDPFSILGLPARFDLDRGQIQRAFLARAAQVHPDRTAVAGGGEAADAASAALNRARMVLDDPEQRAGALLALVGGPAKEQDRSLPDGFLQAMLESREEMESAQQSGDRMAIDRWVAWADEKRRGHIRAVADLFVSLGGRVALTPTGTGAADPSTLAAIRKELNAWRYIERMIEQMENPSGAP